MTDSRVTEERRWLVLRYDEGTLDIELRLRAKGAFASREAADGEARRLGALFASRALARGLDPSKARYLVLEVRVVNDAWVGDNKGG